jgi:hypothetical protein
MRQCEITVSMSVTRIPAQAPSGRLQPVSVDDRTGLPLEPLIPAGKGLGEGRDWAGIFGHDGPPRMTETGLSHVSRAKATESYAVDSATSRRRRVCPARSSGRCIHGSARCPVRRASRWSAPANCAFSATLPRSYGAGRLDHNFAGPFIWIVHELVEPNLRLGSDAQLGLVNKNEVRGGRLPAPYQLLRINRVPGREPPCLPAANALHLVPDRRSTANIPGVRYRWWQRECSRNYQR